MNSQDLRYLQEAYFDVYRNDSELEQLDEAITSEKGKAKAAEMIAKRTTPSGRAKKGEGANVAAIKHIVRSEREGLRGTPPNRKTAGSNWPKSYSGIGGTGNKAKRREAALKKEQVDIYDLILSHLLDEGYAETLEAAETIMVHMSEEWREGIVEEVLSEGEKPFPHEKVERKQKSLRDKGGDALERRMRMGAARRRAKEAEKNGGSQRDAGKGWYHGR